MLKKLLLLTLCLLVLTGCGAKEDAPPTPDAGDLPPASEAPAFFPAVLGEGGGVKVTAAGMSHSAIQEPVVTLEVENKSGKTVELGKNAFVAANGWVVDCAFRGTVEAGKTAQIQVTLDKWHLETAGVQALGSLTFWFTAEDEAGEALLTVAGKEIQVGESSSTKLVLPMEPTVDENGIKLTLLGGMKQQPAKTVLPVWIENDTAGPIVVTLTGLQLDGKEATGIFAPVLPAGGKMIGQIELQNAPEGLQTWKASFLAETWDANYDDLLRTELLIPR